MDIKTCLFNHRKTQLLEFDFNVDLNNICSIHMDLVRLKDSALVWTRGQGDSSFEKNFLLVSCLPRAVPSMWLLYKHFDKSIQVLDLFLKHAVWTSAWDLGKTNLVTDLLLLQKWVLSPGISEVHTRQWTFQHMFVKYICTRLYVLVVCVPSSMLLRNVLYNSLLFIYSSFLFLFLFKFVCFRLPV